MIVTVFTPAVEPCGIGLFGSNVFKRNVNVDGFVGLPTTTFFTGGSTLIGFGLYTFVNSAVVTSSVPFVITSSDCKSPFTSFTL